MSEATFTLGSFALAERIGSGAMGEVWRGEHVASGLPVAIKVLGKRTALVEANRTTLRREVESMARLQCPGIIAVLDFGEVSEDAARGSGGQIIGGSPYIAMEYAGLGALSQVPFPLRWAEAKAVLVCLLDALCHAHAQGVVHRDIKPGNILLAGDGDIRPGLKLSDFGIAHALDPPEWSEEEVSVGTPRYMAPEQFDGRGWEQGPWTDLYTLGAVAFEIATGTHPYNGRHFIELAIQHKTLPIPKIPEDAGVPEGFGAWLAQMMAKRPADRFDSAADALWALCALEDVPSEAVGRSTPTAIKAVLRAADLILGQLDALPSSNDDPLPFPTRWDRTLMAPTPALIGAGLRLYGLRAVPVVGRREIRDALWRSLAKVHADRKPQIVLLRGPTGVGKSCLAGWLSRRAVEVGGALTLHARHGPTAGPGGGLSGMLTRYLRCAGLGKNKAFERTFELLVTANLDDPEAEAEALVELMAPALASDDAHAEATVVLHGVIGRHERICHLIDRLGQKRPVVVWLDDVQWGLDALNFAQYAQGRAAFAPLPAMIVATVDVDQLAGRTLEAELIQELSDSYDVQVIDVPPLPLEDCTRLVEGLLGVEGGLAARVASRCGGHPMFAIELIGDWVERGALESGPHGFVLKTGTATALPRDASALWRQRIESLLAGRPLEDAAALEIAAALGRDVDDAEWKHACVCAGIAQSEGLVGALIDARFAESTDEGWCFVHGMLRESLQRRAETGARWQRHNLACALMISRRHGLSEPTIAERLGRHFLAAREWEVAFSYLDRGAREALDDGGFREALSLIELRAQALEKMRVPDSDPRWGDGHLIEVKSLLELGKLDEARSLATVLRKRATAGQWQEIEGDTLHALGEIARLRGEWLEAGDLFEEALKHHRSNPAKMARDTLALGQIGVWRGQLSRASELLQAARMMAEAMPDARTTPRIRVTAVRHMAEIHRLRGHFNDAKVLFEQARDLSASHLDASELVASLEGLGHSARFVGAMDDALAHYDKAHHSAPGRGPIEEARHHMHTALVSLWGGEYAEARPTLHAVRPIFEQNECLRSLGVALASALPCDAHASDWAAWARNMEGLSALIGRTGLTDPDVAWPLELAARMVAPKGHTAHRDAAAQLAIRQWQALGWDERRAEVARLIQG